MNASNWAAANEWKQKQTQVKDLAGLSAGAGASERMGITPFTRVHQKREQVPSFKKTKLCLSCDSKRQAPGS